MCNLLGRAGQFVADFREVWDILHTPPPAEPEMYTSTCGTCSSTSVHVDGLTDNPIPCCPPKFLKDRYDQRNNGLHPSSVCGEDCSGCCDEWEYM